LSIVRVRAGYFNMATTFQIGMKSTYTTGEGPNKFVNLRVNF